MYISAYVALLLATIITKNKIKTNEKVYKFLMIFLWLMLAFRYGQGQDYFSYQYLYNVASYGYETYLLAIGKNEIGFVALCNLFKKSYIFFVFVVSTYEMIMLNRFIKRYSVDYTFTLLLFFPTLYLTYYFSAIRQGLVIALFIGIMLEKLEKREIKQYIFLCILASSIHAMALILLILPVIVKIPEEKILLIVGVCIVFGIFTYTGIGKSILTQIPIVGIRLQPHMAQQSISIFALLERVIMYICIIMLYSRCKNRIKDRNIIEWIKIYTMGMGIYFAMLSFPLIASRIGIVFKLLEVIIIPYLIQFKTRYRKLIYAFVVTVTAVMFMKNISSYIEQGNYNDNVNVFTYPYISVFNQEAIWKYRGQSNMYQLLE